MEFAFTALVIFLLLMPGIIFNYSYLKGLGRRDGPIAIKRYSDYLVHATIYALILNSLWGWFISWALWRFFKEFIDWTTVFRVLLAQQVDSQHLSIISYHLFGIVWYLLTLYGISAALGTVAHRLVRRKKLDKRSEFFRPDDLWYYMLSGEIVEFPNVPILKGNKTSTRLLRRSSNPISVFLTAIVTHSDKIYVYSGFVMDFAYGRDGGLSWISLLAFDRRPFDIAHTSLASTGLMRFAEEAQKNKQKQWFVNPFKRKKQSEVDAQKEEASAEYTLDSFIVLKYNEISAITLTYLRIQHATSRDEIAHHEQMGDIHKERVDGI